MCRPVSCLEKCKSHHRLSLELPISCCYWFAVTCMWCNIFYILYIHISMIQFCINHMYEYQALNAHEWFCKCLVLVYPNSEHSFNFNFQVISDYTTPPKEELCRDLATKIKPYIRFVNSMIWFCSISFI